MKAQCVTKSIRAVTFDVGGTLIRPWPSVGHIYAEIAVKHGHSGISADLLNQRFKVAWRSCRDFDYSREGWERLVEETFSGLIPSCAGFFPELYERFVQPDAWEIFEDVRPTLDRLAHAGIRMAVVSNWDERLRPLLQQLRLNHYFETLHISCEAGAPKPSPIIFAQAAAGLGLPPQEILHVGDSFEMDFEGARDAGFQSRHLCRGAGSLKPHEISSLNAILEKAI